jgi:hypothetical protein
MLRLELERSPSGSQPLRQDQNFPVDNLSRLKQVQALYSTEKSFMALELCVQEVRHLVLRNLIPQIVQFSEECTQQEFAFKVLFYAAADLWRDRCWEKAVNVGMRMRERGQLERLFRHFLLYEEKGPAREEMYKYLEDKSAMGFSLYLKLLVEKRLEPGNEDIQLVEKYISLISVPEIAEEAEGQFNKFLKENNMYGEMSSSPEE